jgi:plasmid stabilization system protein ParE
VRRQLRLVVSALAARQIREADRWWREHRQKAPDAVREELERVAALVASQPHIGTVATNVRLRGVRRIHIERIHYDLYDRVVSAPEQRIEILAFWGSRRGTGPMI